MKTALENRIVGEMFTREKYRLVYPHIVAEVVRDTIAAIHKIQRDVQTGERRGADRVQGPAFHRLNDSIAQAYADKFQRLPPAERFPPVDDTPEIRPV